MAAYFFAPPCTCTRRWLAAVAGTSVIKYSWTRLFHKWLESRNEKEERSRTWQVPRASVLATRHREVAIFFALFQLFVFIKKTPLISCHYGTTNENDVLEQFREYWAYKVSVIGKTYSN